VKIVLYLARAATLLALVLLAGCANLARTPRPIVVAQLPPSLTPTATLEPTPTPDPSATLRASPTLTPEPTQTPSPTPGCTEAAGRIDSGQIPSTVASGGQVAYAIYFPPCYDTRTRYPVAYLMHGSPDFDERHWLNLGLKDALDRAIVSRRVPPFVVVLPRGDVIGAYGNTSGGTGSWEQVMIEELIPYVDTVYNTLGSKEGRAIGGISRGGVWALEVAFRHPDLFSAVGGHSSALAVNLADPVFDPIDIAQTEQASALRGARIFLDAGDRDWALQQTAELHAILDQQGVPNTFVVGRGTHAADYWASQMDTYVGFYGSTFDGLVELGAVP
jgi:enterochelin esterase-like enzyme